MTEQIFNSAPFFLLRIPVWPVEKYDAILTHENPTETVANLYQTNEQLREAIALASPSLHSCLQQPALKQKIQALRSLSHYLARMTTRATPFGLFSCVSTAYWDETTSISFEPNFLRKRARCDMEWIYSLVQGLYQNERPLSTLSVRTNPLTQLNAGRHKLDYVRQVEKNFSPQAFSIRATKLTKQILNLCQEPFEIRSLLEKLQENLPGLNPEKTLEVIQELITQQFLLPPLPSLLNPAFESTLSHLSPQLNLESVSDRIKSYNRMPPGVGETFLEELQKDMSTIASSKTYLQVDTVYAQNGNLSKKRPIRIRKSSNPALENLICSKETLIAS